MNNNFIMGGWKLIYYLSRFYSLILLVETMLLYANHIFLILHALKQGGQFMSIDTFVAVILFIIFFHLSVDILGSLK